VRGELRVRLHWPASESLLGLESVFIQAREQADREFKVERARPVPKAVLLKLQGVEDRDAAETLRDCGVAVPRDAMPEPDEGEYYLCDLLGAQVAAPSGPVGRVVEVHPYPSVDAVVIETPEGRRLTQPLSEPWLERVDVAAGRVHLSSIDGLID
jgi:16S rRNA processing protein RimM